MAESSLPQTPRSISPPDPASDESLMGLLRQDDALALHELMRRYWRPIIARAIRILNDSDAAADIAQQTFIRLWQRRLEWKPSGAVSAYIFRIARNGALNECRARTTRTRVADQRAAESSASPTTPLQSLEARELQDALAVALDHLPARRKEVYLLARTRHLSHTQISAMMGISPQTVANQMTAAVADLRRDLSPMIDRL